MVVPCYHIPSPEFNNLNADSGITKQLNQNQSDLELSFEKG